VIVVTTKRAAALCPGAGCTAVIFLVLRIEVQIHYLQPAINLCTNSRDRCIKLCSLTFHLFRYRDLPRLSKQQANEDPFAHAATNSRRRNSPSYPPELGRLLGRPRPGHVPVTVL